MSRLIASFVCLALSSIALSSLAVGWTALTVGHYVSYSLGSVNATLQEINRPCGGKAPCGTLADVAKTLNTIRGTAGQVEVAARHENAQLGKIDAQEAQLYADMHSTMLNVQGLAGSLTDASEQASATLHAMNSTVTALQPVETQSIALLNHADATLGHADAILQDPSVARMIDSAADTSLQVDATSTDVRKVADKISNQFLNPPPKHWWNYAGKIWGLAWQGAMLAK